MSKGKKNKVGNEKGRENKVRANQINEKKCVNFY